MVNLAKLRKKAKEKKKDQSLLPRDSGGEGGRRPDEGVIEEPSPGASRHPLPQAGEGTEDKIAKFLESAGEATTEVRQDTVAPQTQRELLTFVISGEQYAIDIDNVVEIVTPRPVTRIPNAGEAIEGILSLRGTIVMLVDARRRLHHPPSSTVTADTRVIVVQQDSENIGFTVDRVLRVVKIEPQEIDPPPIVHSSEHDESVRGVFKQGDALTILLDLSKLVFTSHEWN